MFDILSIVGLSWRSEGLDRGLQSFELGLGIVGVGSVAGVQGELGLKLVQLSTIVLEALANAMTLLVQLLDLCGIFLFLPPFVLLSLFLALLFFMLRLLDCLCLFLRNLSRRSGIFLFSK